MNFEIHLRPMILPHIAGVSEEHNQCEVDVWLRHDDGTAEVILELVAPNREHGDILAGRLFNAMLSAVFVPET